MLASEAPIEAGAAIEQTRATPCLPDPDFTAKVAALWESPLYSCRHLWEGSALECPVLDVTPLKDAPCAMGHAPSLHAAPVRSRPPGRRRLQRPRCWLDADHARPGCFRRGLAADQGESLLRGDQHRGAAYAVLGHGRGWCAGVLVGASHLNEKR